MEGSSLRKMWLPAANPVKKKTEITLKDQLLQRWYILGLSCFVAVQIAEFATSQAFVGLRWIFPYQVTVGYAFFFHFFSVYRQLFRFRLYRQP